MEVNENNDLKKKETNKMAIKSKEFIKGLSLQTKIIVILIIVILVMVLILFGVSKYNDAKHTINVKSSLQKIVNINELSTIDYTYNAIAVKYKDDKVKKGNEEYYVAYEGTVTAGIDFNEIDIQIDGKKIMISLPAVEIHDVRVNMGSMDYIKVVKTSESDRISQEAYRICKADLKKRLENEENLNKFAKENAISAVEALFKPWIESLGEDYEMEIQ